MVDCEESYYGGVHVGCFFVWHNCEKEKNFVVVGKKRKR
jgi:hypothetical protein